MLKFTPQLEDYLLIESVSVSSLLSLLGTESVTELRVPELTRKFISGKNRVDVWNSPRHLFSMSLNLEVICAAVRLEARAAAISTRS